MLRRWITSLVIFVLPLWAHADWAADRDASAGYVTVTTLATAVDEAVPFCVVYLSDLPADFHTAMSTASDTDGKTIRVSTSDGATQLACVPIGVNTSTDTGCLIFLGTGMSASVDVDYRIYVGNAALSMPSASGGMGEQAVFAAYAGVYFPGVDTRDWTSGGRTLTAVNSPGTAASGYEGITAATYNGTSSYHYYSGTQGVNDWPITMETIAYCNNTTTDSNIFTLRKFSTTQPLFTLYFRGNTGSDRVIINARGDSGSTVSASTSTTFSSSTYYYLTATRDDDSGTLRVKKDAASEGTNTASLVAPTWDSLAIGASRSTSVGGYLPGRVAVALLSSSVRSANFIATMQDNWAGALYSAGAWTALGSSCTSGSTGWVLFTANSQTTTANADWSNLADSLVDDANTTDVSLDDGGVFLSETLRFYDMDYDTATIPAGADSYTVTIRVKKDFAAGGGREMRDEIVYYVDETSTQIGDNLAVTLSDWPSTVDYVYYTVTGHTFDGTEFDADSGFVIQADAENTNGATLAEIYVAEIKVDWTCPGGGAFPLLLISEE